MRGATILTWVGSWELREQLESAWTKRRRRRRKENTQHSMREVRYIYTAGRPFNDSMSFASLIFLGLIIGRKFLKLRQSTAFYSAFRTISGVKKFLSGTYFFFASKLEKKLSKSELEKIFKNNFGSNKSEGNFSPRLSKHYSFLEL